MCGRRADGRTLQPNVPAPGTKLLGAADAALPMAQRLGARSRSALRVAHSRAPAARRFKKQIFLALDVPPGADQLLLVLERALVAELKAAEGIA
jgi:hypothetical protein